MLKRFPSKNIAGKPSPEKLSSDVGISLHFYRLYFKGLVRDDSLAVFGVAICGQKDDLLFQLNGPIHGSDITVLEAELSALKQGLTQVLSLGITHISIYCDYYPIYQLISGRSVPREKKTALLMNNIQHIRKQFKSSFSIFKVGNSFRYVYKLAKEAIKTEISIPVDPSHQGSCSICLDDNIHANKMFYIDKCRHRFCDECVKRHIEVKLLEGSVIRCPHFGCKSNLTLGRCANLLTPKLVEMWERKIREDSIPVCVRVYCPKPSCSDLMSKTELSKSTKETEVRKYCVKSGEPFCINCKVPWHNDLSCNDYKRLGPNPTEDDIKLIALANKKLWRQCGNCQHMIERSQGCSLVTCRCGYRFCYTCGAKWKETGYLFHPPQVIHIVAIFMSPSWKRKGAEAKALAEPVSKTVSELQSSLVQTAQTEASSFLSSCNILL